MKGKRFTRTFMNANGGLDTYMSCSYEDLRAGLGPSLPASRDGKVSTCWNVLDQETGKVIRIYEYKETSLYSKGLPSVREFRKLPSYEWHISGTIAPGRLLAFVLAESARKREAKARAAARKAAKQAADLPKDGCACA
jgi:hypothetical protein